MTYTGGPVKLSSYGPAPEMTGVTVHDASPAEEVTGVTVHDASPAEDDSPESILSETSDFISRFCVLPDHAVTAVTLWVAHTHRMGDFDSTPRLAFMAPEKQCGKSRAQEVIETLVPNPLRSSNVSVAVLFRSISSPDVPTIFLDEVDTIWSAKGEAEDLRGIVNAGHRRGVDALRVVGEGASMKLGRFAQFAAICLAGIGDLPDTVADRSILVPMRRRLPNETVERWRFRTGEAEGHELRERISSMMSALPLGAHPQIPEEISDRAADVWEPLLEIAEAVGSDWHRDALIACEVMTSRAPATVSSGVRLLTDIRTVWKPGVSDLPTADLITRLIGLDESPWGMEPPITARRLAFLLKKYGVEPRHTANLRFYRQSDFTDPWLRYCSSPAQDPSSSVTSVTASPEEASSSVTSITDDLLSDTTHSERETP